MRLRITIKDIAERAGVSRGTVDRVIHKRGKVAPQVKAKVRAVIDDLGYEKNIFASTLAYNKTIRIAVLSPNPEIDPYWQQFWQGIEKAYEAVKHYGLAIEHFFFYEMGTKDFPERSLKALESQPDAIILAPIFSQEAKDFIQVCYSKKIPVVTVNTSMMEKETLCYIGQDSYQSGVVAARLLNFGLNSSETVMMLNLELKSYSAKNLLEKEKGFRDYFAEIKEKKIKIISCGFEEFEHKKELNTFFHQQLEKYPNLAGVFITNSRAYRLVDSLEETLVKKIKIVGFDLVKPNLDYLFSGKINFLINQNPFQQGYLGVYNLIDHLIHKREVEKIHYLPLDIVVSENASYYLKKQASFRAPLGFVSSKEQINYSDA